LSRHASAADVVRVVGLLERAEIEIWLDGGWGVDALLGEETRPHADLDLVLRASDFARVRAALGAAGFRERPGATGANAVFESDTGCAVDAHGVEIDPRGFAIFSLPDGRHWPFPPSALRGEGRVAGRAVRCLSAEAQVHCHGQGYTPTEKDLQDMERLQARFGVVLPLILCRQNAGV
jgi:lincosamide nucleotidyltransferase A/C/D/E